MHRYDTTHLDWCGHVPAEGIDYCWGYAYMYDLYRNLPICYVRLEEEYCKHCDLYYQYETHEKFGPLGWTQKLCGWFVPMPWWNIQLWQKHCIIGNNDA